ncbi:NPCBM/NEW2 domain-containing protein [Fodinicola acaciae]|uniref:NPCBM/NEW2 domain-containing protein n=1 Tax=Fodinicola acaciae TaxID=2681555 RepID=UPI001C9E4AEB|nr:NPCBM/NEW2 domain-containing protein [Fodinicola acaciae]
MRRTVLALVLFAASLVALTPQPAAAATPVAPLASPPMGWNSWNKFGCDINENLIKQTADAMVANGLDRLGYQYVNIDDCWMARTRDGDGKLQADPTRFPSGIKALADYVHAKGLKLGIYSSAGTATCAGFPASLDHETDDANSFAAWGVDYLKYDNCNNLGRPALDRYRAMGNALRATGRPIVYSLCNWGYDNPWQFGPATGASLWRTTGDITDSWDSMTSLLDQQAGLEPFSHQSAWNDPDMLEVGNGGMTDTEYRAHFSLWSLLNAPLILGNDLRSIPAATKAIIGSPDVIAVNQDWGGSQGRRVADFGDTEVWAKPMSDGSVAVVLFNRTAAAATVTTSAAAVGLGGSTAYGLKDLWSGATSTTNGGISATVPSHGVVMYRVSRAGTAQAALGAGSYQVSDLTWLDSSNGWGPVERDRSNGEQAAGDGRGLSIGGTAYARGLGAHADSAVHLWLGGSCTRFSSFVGIDDEVGAGKGAVRFAVYGDGQLLAYSDLKSGGQPATALNVPTAGVKALELRVTDGRDTIDDDHADWANAQVVCSATGTGSYVSDRTWSSAANGFGPAERDQSNGEQPAGDGNVQDIAGAFYPKGVGAHPDSDIAFAAGGCKRLVAVGGVDAENAGRGSVTLSVVGDSTTLYTSPTVTAGAPVVIDVDITGRTTVHLVVGNAGDGPDYDHADWGDVSLVC